MANARARHLRTNSTDAERKLWRFLRSLKPQGLHFCRQVPIDHVIVDFACYSAASLSRSMAASTTPHLVSASIARATRF